MKRIIVFIMVIVTILALCATVVSAEGNNVYSWYCIRTKNNNQPPLPSEFNFINNYNGYYIGKEPDEKVIYLTFDVGYENGNVEKILDILKDHNAPAAFFILSNLVEKNPELITRMADEGHTLCNHTSKHKDMTKISDIESFEAEISTLEKLCYNKTGKTIAKYFRPPEGKFNENTLNFANTLGYKTIFWSFAYADWDNNNQMSVEKAKEKVLSNVHNGAVMLFHPTSKTNSLILSDVLTELENKGYRFGTLDELTSQN